MVRKRHDWQRAKAWLINNSLPFITPGGHAFSQQLVVLNPLLPSVLNIGRLTKIWISIKEGTIKKISYERRAYESVDD